MAPYGSNGLPAGKIAARMEVLPSSLSFHLRQMTQAGLLVQRRSSRQIICAVDQHTMEERGGRAWQRRMNLHAPHQTRPATLSPSDTVSAAASEPKAFDAGPPARSARSASGWVTHIATGSAAGGAIRRRSREKRVSGSAGCASHRSGTPVPLWAPGSISRA